MKNLRNLGIAVALAATFIVYDNVRQPQAQGGFSDQRNYSASASTGTANAQIVALPNYGRQVGVTVWFVPGSNNTAATTLNINGTGAANVKRSTNQGLQDLVGGEFVSSNGPVSVMWTGSVYVITNRLPDRIGETVAFRNNTIPNGYLIEDGSCVSQTTYAGLFAAISTTYGSCSAGLFKLPDSRGRAIAGLDNQGSAGAASRLTSAGSGCTATALTGTGCGLQNSALTSTNQFPPYTPGGNINPFTPTGNISINPFGVHGHVGMVNVLSGSITVPAGNSGVKAVAGSTYSLAGGVGIGTGDALTITDNRVIDFNSDTVNPTGGFTGDSLTPSFVGSAVGSSSPITTLSPLSLARYAIKA